MAGQCEPRSTLRSSEFSVRVSTQPEQWHAEKNRDCYNTFRNTSDIHRHSHWPAIRDWTHTTRWFAANLHPKKSFVSSRAPPPPCCNRGRSGGRGLDGLSRRQGVFPVFPLRREHASPSLGSLQRRYHRCCRPRRCCRARV